MPKDDHIIEEMLNSESDLTEKQKQILAAATEMFAEKGFAATSTKEIAQKAGVAEGTIFRHYKTKKDLLLSIVTPMMVKMIAPVILKDLNKVLNNGYENFEDFLRAMFENRKAFLEKNMRVVRIVIQEIPFQEELREQFIEHIGMKVFSRFVEIVEHYQAKGQIIDMPVGTVIRIAGSTFVGYFVTKYAVAPKAQWDDQAEIDRMIHFLMKGLAPEK